MTLIGTTVLQGEQGVINGSLIGDGNDLTLNFTTETAIAGDGNGINNLTVVGPALLGASVTTEGSQTYESPITLSATTTLTGTSGTFIGGLDGNGNDLTLNFSTITIIDANNVFSNLRNLTSKGDVTLNGTIETTGNQAYEKNVSLSGSTVLTGQNGMFGGPITGNNNDLTLNFSDTTTITDSQLQDINNLVVGGGGSVEISGTISTTGSQQYLDDIVLTGDTTLVSGSGSISTEVITDGAADYTLTLGDSSQTGAIELGGNVSINSLESGANNFDITISGTNNTFDGVAAFKNTGTISLGDEETDTTLFAGGLNTTAGSSTRTGGTIRTRGTPIVINKIHQVTNTTIDTTDERAFPNGSQIRLLDGVELNGQELKTDGGTTGRTRVAGNSIIDDGKVIVEEGDLDIGEETVPGNLTLTRDTIFRMDGGGAININPNSMIDAASHSLTMVTNVLNIDPDAGDVTASHITITPQNKSLDVFLGTSAGGSLDVGQESFDHLKSPDIVIGETGYAGTIHVGELTVSTGRLTLIADGTGGAIDISEGLNLTSSTGGISLYVQGSGATTELNGTITTAGDAIVEDAVRLVGDTSIETAGGDVTITGGTEGIYSQSGSNFNLSIDAGTGTVALGSLAGFGDGSGTGSLLSNVTVSGDSIELNAPNDSVAGDFEFNGPVTITGLASSTQSMSAANIRFQSTIDASASSVNGLVLNSQGTTSFSGTVGATHQLASLTTDNGGTTAINGGIGQHSRSTIFR